MWTLFRRMGDGAAVPLLAGGAADGDTFVGLFTSGMNVIPSWEHLFHGSASKYNYGQANSTTYQPRKHFCKVLCTNLLRKGERFRI